MSEEFFVQNDGSGDILRQISGQLRLSLANIYNALERIAPPEARDKDSKIVFLNSLFFHLVVALTNN